MRIGIDLLWVRVGICGGTESYIRNLLDGFVEFDPDNNYILFTARDNAYSFQEYMEYPNVSMSVCEVDCANQAKRILWENRNLDKRAQKEDVDVMFIPVYSKPRTYGSGIVYVCVIHDLQALHYPQYFSGAKRMFLKYTWWNTCKTSDKVITISDYCKDDLVEHYPFVKDKVQTIYDPVISKASEMDFSVIERQYGIQKNAYFYCVSSMLPHKNLDTILKVMAQYRKMGNQNYKLVISGVGGQEEQIMAVLKAHEIEEQVILTGFVSNEERDCLYENCRLFLFPSIFEGFGMPPIEAMRKGKNVIMTKEFCLEEVTKGKAIYVDKPLDVREWMDKIEDGLGKGPEVVAFEEYELRNIVEQYINVFQNIKGQR